MTKDLENCPLCGKYLEDAESSGVYSGMEDSVFYPELTIKDEIYRNFLREKALFLILTVAFTCLFINILMTPHSLWSGYVFVAGFIAFFGVITAIYKKRRMYATISGSAVLLPIAAAAFELLVRMDSGNFSRFISLEYVIPAMLLGIIAVCDVMIFTDTGKNKYYLSALMLVTVISLIPQIVIWSLNSTLAQGLSFTLFVFCLLNFAVMTIVWWSRFKAELGKKFHI